MRANLIQSESKGGNQGGNQGGNRFFQVPTLRKSSINNGLINNEVWISVSDGSHLLGVTTRAVKKACKGGKYVTRLVQGNGGMQYRILLQSLPKIAQQRWEVSRLQEMDKELERPSVEMVRSSEDDVLDIDELQRLYCESPDYNRKKYEKFYPFFLHAGYFKYRHLPTYSRLVEMIEEWNAMPDRLPLNYGGVKRIEKELREHGYSAFFGSYGQSAGVHLSFAKIDNPEIANHLFQTFRTNYLKASAPTAEVCFRLVKLEAKRLGVDVSCLPAAVSFARAVKSELFRKFGVSEASALYRARFGAEAWARKFGNYCDRNDDDLVAGSTWVFDHMQVDQMVKAPDGTLRRFWLTGIVDMRSWKFLYYSLSTVPPCTDDIKLAYIGAVVKHGVPETVYLDNGKDFRSRDFSGQTKKVRVQYAEQFIGSVLGMTGVQEIKFALPYNAKTKPIERVFRKLHNHLERVVGDGYTGSTPTQRTKEMKAMIKAGRVMSYEEFVAVVDTVIGMLNAEPMSRKRETTNGMTPDEVFERFGGVRQDVEPDVLYRLTGRMSTMRQVGRNGFEDSEVSKLLGYRAQYWGDWMLAWQGNGDRVYARRDLDAPDVAFFYAERDHRYLGAGHLDFFRTMSIAKPGAERDQVSRVMGAVQGHNRTVAAAIRPNGGATGREILTSAAGESLQLMQGEARVPKAKAQVAKATGTDSLPTELPTWKKALYDSCWTDEEREEYENMGRR